MSDLSLTPAASPSRLSRGRRRRRSRSARLARAAAVVMMLAGALALIDAGVTLVWQEPLSALYATLRQSHLAGALRHLERAAPTPAEKRELASIGDQRRRITYLAAELQRHAEDGSAIGRILAPTIGVDFVLIKGVDTEDLKSGPGVDTNLPGVGQTTLIAGHRTTYLAPFRHIDSLGTGERIFVNMPYAHFTYTVTGRRVVLPGRVGAAIAEIGYTRLVLSACTPLFSAEKRLLVFARLTRTVPVGAARTLPGGALARPIDARTHAPVTARAPRPLPAMLESLDPQLVAPLV